jgi:hypothetical protein
VAAYDAAGNTSAQSTATSATTQGTTQTESPYTGTRPNIPGTIEAENYDLGGEGIAYHDADTINTLGAYRTDGVDVKTCTDTTGCGFAVGTIAGGEWLNYMVNVTTAVPTPSPHVLLPQRKPKLPHRGRRYNVTGSIAVPVNETVWDGSWATVTKTGVNLTAGNHTVRFVMDTTNYMDVNNFTWTLPAPAPTAFITANPTSISAGQSSSITWSSTNATSCTGTNFTATGVAGSVTVTPTQTTTYSVTCTGAGGTSPAASVTVTVKPPQQASPKWGSSMTSPTLRRSIPMAVKLLPRLVSIGMPVMV